MDQSSWKQQYRWLPALVLLCCLPAGAATVYRTVDENGVVSFSDMRPAGDTPVETMVINAQAPQVSEAAQQRLQDMRETTDRMATDRMAREKHRAEMRQLQAQGAQRGLPLAEVLPSSTGARVVFSDPDLPGELDLALLEEGIRIEHTTGDAHSGQRQGRVAQDAILEQHDEGRQRH